MGDECDVGTHGMRMLHTHVAESAKPHDPHLLPWAGTPFPQWRIRSNACAEQGGCNVEFHTVRNAQNVVVLDHDRRGVATVGDLTVGVLAVVRGDEALDAVVLQALQAVLALQARADENADPYAVTWLERGDVASDFLDDAGDLVPRNHGEDRGEPLFACLMDIRVADAGVLDVDEHIVRTEIAPLDGVGLERCSG